MTSLVTAAQVARLRRMIAEPTFDPYTDALLISMIELHPMLDVFGEEPYLWAAGDPPTSTANPAWIPTFDLNAAAADIWEEKAALLVMKVDFSADGGNYQMSQQYEMAAKMARKYRARRSISTIHQETVPNEPASNTPLWIGNNPEPDV